MNHKGYTIHTSHNTAGWRWVWIGPDGAQQVSMLHYHTERDAVNGAVEAVDEDIQTQEFASGDY
jgi:hypothetical protein